MLTSVLVLDFENFQCLIFVLQSVHTVCSVIHHEVRSSEMSNIFNLVFQKMRDFKEQCMCIKSHGNLLKCY
jgi:hypothetical protein